MYQKFLFYFIVFRHLRSGAFLHSREIGKMFWNRQIELKISLSYFE